MKIRAPQLLVACALAPLAAAQNPPPLHTYSATSLDDFGSAVAVGPVDLDGVPDLVVGARYTEAGGVPNTGSVSAYSGATHALLWEIGGTVAYGNLGQAVAVAGDLNGDGRGEVLVGSPNEDNASGSAAGRVQVLSGLDGSLLFDVTGSGDYDCLGAAVAGLPDFDGNGTDDLAVGVPTQGAGSAGISRVLILSGNDGAVLATLVGDDPGWGAFGAALARIADADGDGVDDLAIGEPWHDGAFAATGRVAVHSGATGALIRAFQGPTPQERLGVSVAGAGDVDGDGREDVIAGAAALFAPGYARVYSPTSGAMLRELSTGATGFGISVAGVGDFDGDATLDFAVGTVDVYVTDPGIAQVFSGACGRILAEYRGTNSSSRRGWALASPGDLDGDSRSELVVAEPGALEVTIESGYTRPPIVAYCTAGVSANGCQAVLSGAGAPSASAVSGFDLIASSVEGGQGGIFYFGTNGRQSRAWGGGSSFQCVTPPVKRTAYMPGGGTAGACDGSFALDLNAYWRAHPSKDPGAGSLVQAQLWYRDPGNAAGPGSGLSNAVELSPCP